VPYRLGFLPNEDFPNGHWGFTLLDASCDAIFFVDFVFHFRLAFWRSDNLVIETVPILRRYMRTMLLPINFGSVVIAMGSLGSGYQHLWVRAPLLLRLFQVPIITDEIFRFYDAANFSARKLTKLMFVWVMMLHMLSSFKGVIQRWDNDPMSTELYGFREYMHSLWWTVTALTSFGTIPTPSSNVQLTYSSGVLVGSFVTSVYIIGNMGVLISNLDAAAVSFRKRRDAVDMFVVKQGLPNELASRLHMYQECAWARGAGQNLQFVVQQMNPTIRADIMHHICHSIFVTIPLFEGCGPKFISALMETMQLEVFPQHEWVCHKGSISTAMYIVMVGTVSVIIDEERMVTVKRLTPGDFFGERSLFGSEKRNASIQAKTTVDLVVLRASRFMQVLQLYPEVRRSIEDTNLRREAETKAASSVMNLQDMTSKKATKRHTVGLRSLSRVMALSRGESRNGSRRWSDRNSNRRSDCSEDGGGSSMSYIASGLERCRASIFAPSSRMTMKIHSLQRSSSSAEGDLTSPRQTCSSDSGGYSRGSRLSTWFSSPPRQVRPSEPS